MMVVFQVQDVGNVVNKFRGHEQSHEEAKRVYCRSLPEDHRRRYAAIEALKIDFGVTTMSLGNGTMSSMLEDFFNYTFN